MARARTVAESWGAVLALLVICTVWFFAGKVPGKDLPTARLSQDARYYYVWAPSLLLDGDLDFTNDYKVVGNVINLGKAPGGMPSNVFGVGPALYASPFFLVGHALAKAGAGPADGYGATEIKATLFASCLFGVLALVPVILLLRRRAGLLPLPAQAVAIAMWLAGPSLFYSVRQPGYSHPFALCFTAWLLERWDASFDEAPRSRRTWVVLGALFGAATLARPQLVLWGLCLVWAALDDLKRGGPWRRCAAHWAMGAGAALVVFLPQMIVWKVMYGRIWLVPQGPGFMRWDDPAWSEVLFSSRNGLLPWSPAYVLALVGLGLAFRFAPRLAAALLGGFVLQLAVNAAAWDWWGGGSFGGRRFDSCFVAFAVGAAALARPLFQRGRSARVWAVRGAAGAACLSLLLLAVANTLFVRKRSSFTVPNAGLGAASTHLDKIIAGPFGAFAGWMSSLSNAPARLAFAWKYGTGVAAYDRVEGYYFLKEHCPCMEPGGKLGDQLRLTDPKSPFVVGLVQAGPGDRTLRLAGAEARLLVPLNLRGEVTVSLQAAAPAGAPVQVALAWNGARVATAEVGAASQALRFTTREVRRGVNELTVTAPPGTRLFSVDLSMPAPRGVVLPPTRTYRAARAPTR